MEKQLLLKRIQYSIPSTSVALAGNIRSHSVPEHLPLMKVQIDFEKGELELEGDWYFMMFANTYHDESWLQFHRDRVLVKTDIYPAISIDLNDIWKKSLIKYDIKGYNAYTENQTSEHPIIKAYKVGGYPTTCLIDKKGNIFNANPSNIAEELKKQIEDVLKVE